jgi:hypothetical protein
MDLRSMSASSAVDYEACPAQFKAKYIDRHGSLSGSAAMLGTACHEAMRRWVEEGHYQKMQPGMVATALMLSIFDEEYVKLFSNPARQVEGRKLVTDWLKRQDWNGRKVLSTEIKGEIMLPVIMGGVQTEIPFRFIRDRVDELDDGTIEVVDYKTVSWPMQPEDLLTLPQSRAYAWVTAQEHPGKRIRVKFDLLRYDSVGCVFDQADIDEAGEYLHRLAQRIVDDPGIEETPNVWCRSCIRRNHCATLQGIVSNLGKMNPLTGDPAEAIHEHVRLKAAQGYLKNRMDEVEALLKTAIENSDTGDFENDGLRATLSSTRRRSVDNDELRDVLPPELFNRIANVGLSDLDDLLKSNLLNNEEKSMVAACIRQGRTKPSVRITKVK